MVPTRALCKRRIGFERLPSWWAVHLMRPWAEMLPAEEAEHPPVPMSSDSAPATRCTWPGMDS